MSDISSTSKPVIVTPGDPAGIGAEITLKAALTSPIAFVAIADPAHMADAAKKFGINIPIHVWQKGTVIEPGCLTILEHNWPAEIIPGKPIKENSLAIIDAIKSAVSEIRSGNASALVTNPINKFILYQAGFKFPGHTEFLATLSSIRTQPVMMLANKFLRVIPTTIHNPVSEIPSILTYDLLYKTIVIARQDLITDFGIPNPRIAVCGLNPHAGEQGALGSEEIDMISPVISQLLSEDIHIDGPLPADTLFHQEARDNYDLVIGMYHDQVLPVVKTLDFNNTVNITLGLDFIRTSPDHGTAYNIAGKNIAKCDSLLAAISYAENLSQTRGKYTQINSRSIR